MTSPTLGFTSSASRRSSSQNHTRLRLRITATDRVSVTRVVKELKTCCGITLQTAPVQSFWGHAPTHAVDLDLQGPLANIQQVLRRLQTFPVTIQGRANPDGDSWYC